MSKHSAPVEVGQRACEEFNRYANENGLTIQQASEKIGVERKASTLWSNGGSPSASALCRLAAVGADVQYIITGKRTEPVVVHVPIKPYAGVRYCAKCGAKMDEEEL